MSDDDQSINFAEFAAAANQNARRQRTSAVASQIRNAPREDQRGMQAMRHQLSFGDGAEEDFDGMENGAAAAAVVFADRSGSTATRPKNLPAAAAGDLSSPSAWPSDEPPQEEEFPDQTVIIERLMSIRQHKQQVLDMMDKLKEECGDGEIDKDMLRKLVEAYDNFKEQEEQYLSILQKILALKTQYTVSLENTPVPQPESENVAPMQPAPSKPVRRPEEKVRAAAPPPPPAHFGENGMNGSGYRGEVDDEMRGLIAQRDMLKQMLRQQEELRALQGRHKAQQGQNAQQDPMTNECETAYQQVYGQQEQLAAKRRELEDLKKQLDVARSAYASTQDEDEQARDVRPAAAAGVRQQHQLEDKLKVLRGKKQRMDEIINELNALQESGDDGGQPQQQQQQRPMAMAQMMPNVPIPLAVNQTGARPKQPMTMPQNLQARASMPRNFNGVNPIGVSPAENIQRKLQELEATKSRLAHLQSLVTELEDNGGAMMTPNGLGVSPHLLRLVNELETEGESEVAGGDGGDDDADMSAFSMQMRSAYESKINEQREAVDKLQEEHSRLTAIKNQLLKLNPLADPLAAEKAAERGGMLDLNAIGQSANAAAGGNMGRPNENAWRDLFQSQTAGQSQRHLSESRATPEQRLNNTRDNASLSELSAHLQRNSRPSIPLASAGGSFATASFISGDGDELEMEPAARSRRGTDSGGSTIVSNPRLASFRRNNQLEEVQKQHRQATGIGGGQRTQQDGNRCQSTPIAGGPSGADRSGRRRRSSTNVEQQYQQLQQHIDSIRLIFQDLMKEQGDENGGGSGGGGGGGGQPNSYPLRFDQLLQQQARSMQNSMMAASAPVTPSSWDVLSMNPSAMAAQQHQLMLSLLACQQQLQLQQLEMRYLQQLCQELWQSNYNNGGDGNRTRSGSVNSVNQQQQQAGGGGSMSTSVTGVPFMGPNFAPFDGRPLSSASLYNLLAPNPYLTFPYYTPPQLAGQSSFGAMAAARGFGARSNNNGNGGGAFPRGASVLNNSSGTSKSNRNAETASATGGRAMSSSVVGGHDGHRGASMSDRMIVSDSELSIVGEAGSSPFKVGAAAAASGRHGEFSSPAAGGNKSMVPKLNLEDSYKSNVGKSLNKNSNVAAVGQTNGIIPEQPSRASSTGGAVSHSGNMSALENGCMTPEQFDLMREVIYSEVATLISQNEQRPTFLLELFRELQLLSNDYLRARALDAIRDILNRYLTDDADVQYNTDQENERWAPVNIRSGLLPGTPIRGGGAAARTVSAERNETRNFQSPSTVRDKAREFVEGTVSESSTSSAMENADGASSNLEKPTSRQKRFENLEGIKDVKNSFNNMPSTAPKETSGTNGVSRSQSSDLATAGAISTNGIVGAAVASGGSKVDVSGLEQQIQSIVDELIPFVRGNVDAECSPQLLQYIRKLVLELTTSKCIPPESVSTFFRLQLSSILDDTLAKFKGQKLHECGAEMLADVSEVVFNELAFFRLMQNIDTSLVSRQSQGADSETSAAESGNVTSESAEIVSDTNGERGESELSSSRQSSLEDELSPMSGHDAVSEVSEDLSAVTAVSVSREASKIASGASKHSEGVAASDIETPSARGQHGSEPSRAAKKPVFNAGHRKSIETVLTGPLTVHVTSATDEEEITTTTNNSSSSINTTSSSSGSQSMHTAGNGSITSGGEQPELAKTSPTSGSRETSPPEDAVVDEVPEQLEQEPTPPTDTNDVTFDLTFEPHPEDQVHLSSAQNSARGVRAPVEDEEEEEGEDIRRSTTPVVARAVAYLAESPSTTPTDVGGGGGSTDVTNLNEIMAKKSRRMRKSLDGDEISSNSSTMKRMREMLTPPNGSKASRSVTSEETSSTSRSSRASTFTKGSKSSAKRQRNSGATTNYKRDESHGSTLTATKKRRERCSRASTQSRSEDGTNEDRRENVRGATVAVSFESVTVDQYEVGDGRADNVSGEVVEGEDGGDEEEIIDSYYRRYDAEIHAYYLQRGAEDDDSDGQQQREEDSQIDAEQDGEIGTRQNQFVGANDRQEDVVGNNSDEYQNIDNTNNDDQQQVVDSTGQEETNGDSTGQEDTNDDEDVQYISTDRMSDEEYERRFVLPIRRRPLPYVPRPRRFFKSGPITCTINRKTSRKTRSRSISARIRIDQSTTSHRDGGQFVFDNDIYVFRDDVEWRAITSDSSSSLAKKKKKRSSTVYDGASEIVREVFNLSFCGRPSKIIESERREAVNNKRKKKTTTKASTRKSRVTTTTTSSKKKSRKRRVDSSCEEDDDDNPSTSLRNMSPSVRGFLFD